MQMQKSESNHMSMSYKLNDDISHGKLKGKSEIKAVTS